MASAGKLEHVLSVAPRWATGPKDTYSKFNEKLAALSSTNSGQNIKVISTTLTEESILKGTREAKNAENSSVSVIGALRPLGYQEKPSDDWLNVTPHCYYRRLLTEASVVDVILAHGPEYVWGALNIQDAFYPGCTVIIFNHSFPDNPNKGVKKDMRDSATKANLIVSFDKETYDKYQDLYGGAMDVEHKLVEIAHISVELLLQLTTTDAPDGRVVTPKSPVVVKDEPAIPHCSTEIPKSPAVVKDATPKSPTVQKADVPVASLSADMKKLALQRSMSVIEWHNKITPTLKKFHDDHAKLPQDAIKKAMPYFEGTMKKVEGKLKEKNMCVRFEYTGSGYEKVMINESDIEFDLMVVMSEGTDLEAEQFEDGTGGYYLLNPIVKPDCQNEYAKLIHTPETGVISPEKVVNFFFSALQKTLNETDDTRKTKLRKHGPAVQMDVYHDVNKTQKWFSVDIVPAYQIRTPTEVQLFVAKPYKNAAASNQSWRRSFSVEEKKKFKEIDKGDGCRRMCIRILKAIIKPPPSITRKPDSSFSHVSSFLLKNTLFHLNEEDSVDWSIKKLGPRTVQMISQLALYVETGYFPHFYLPGVNIVAGLEDGPRKNLADRLWHLVSSEIEFRKVIGAE